MEEKFTNHLKEIGIIDKKTENQILSLYKQKYSGERTDKIRFNELMTEILIIIFNNLNEIQRKFKCFHLPAKFIKLTDNYIKQKLKNFLEKKSLKTKLILQKYLFRWNKNINRFRNKKVFSLWRYNKNNKQIKNNNINSKENNNINDLIKTFYLFNVENSKNKNNNNNTFNNIKKSKSNNNSIDKNYPFQLMKNLKIKPEENKKKNLNDLNSKKIISQNNNKIYHQKNNHNLIPNNNYINYREDNIINQKNICNKDIYELIKDNNYFLNTSTNKVKNQNINNKAINDKKENFKNFSQSYSNNISLMNSYNIKDNKKFISKPVSSCNIRKKNINEKNIDFINGQQVNLNKIKNKNNLIQNLIDEDLENDTSFSLVNKTPKTKNSSIHNYYDNILYYTNKYRSSDVDYNSFTLYPPFTFSEYKNNINYNIKRPNSNRQISTYNRLFEDSKIRINKLNKKRLEQEKYIENLSKQVNGEKKVVDISRINDLYKDKERSNNLEKTKAKVEKEEGITFKPLISKTKYSKRIYSNFMDRNYYNKGKSSNNYNNNNNDNMNNQRKMSKKQREKIIKDFIERMNSNSNHKSLSNSCDKYTRESNNKFHKNKL